MHKEIIYIDMDDVLAQYSISFSRAIKNNPSIQFPQSQPGFFVDLIPVDGAINAVNKLRRNYDVYILTAPSVKNPLCYTEKRLWIEKYFDLDFCHKLIICSNKGLLKGDYLIDDNITGKGQENFEGKLIQFGTDDCMDWSRPVSFDTY